MIYFHGGGAFSGGAEYNIPLMNRYAYEAGITIVNANYRLAPEAPAPKGIYDAYAIVKDVLANADRYGIDAKRVGVFGESGGAYITAGVGLMMAERNEGHLVKF